MFCCIKSYFPLSGFTFWMLIIPILNVNSLKSIYDQFFVHYIVWTFTLSLKVNVLYIYVKGHLIYVKFTCLRVHGRIILRVILRFYKWHSHATIYKYPWYVCSKANPFTETTFKWNCKKFKIFYILQVSLKLTHILWDRFICKTLVLQQSDSKIKHLIILVYDNYLLTLLCPLILIYQLQINLCTWCKYIVYDYRLKI